MAIKCIAVLFAGFRFAASAAFASNETSSDGKCTIIGQNVGITTPDIHFFPSHFSVDTCCDLCTDYPGCGAFSLNASGCALKKDGSGLKAATGVTSGINPHPKPAPVLTRTELRTKISKLKSGDKAKFVLSDSFSAGGNSQPAIVIESGVDVTIIGDGNAVFDNANTPGNVSFFSVVGNAHLSLEGLVLINGRGQFGGAINSSGTLDAKDCEFRKNTAYQGGAIYIELPTGETHLTNCTFTENVASGVGGAIITDCNEQMHLIGCKFTAPVKPTSKCNEQQNGVYNNAAQTVFECPKGTKGTPFNMPSETAWCTSQLPPTKALVHCS
jgi:predicted outer membrane repeat protein